MLENEGYKLEMQILELIGTEKRRKGRIFEKNSRYPLTMADL
jgi:hypothetical protein